MKGDFMKEFIYRRLKKSDYNEVQNLISDAFGLHDYVEDEKMLEKVKKMYLYSCLSEQKFSRVAVHKGKIVGIIMGASKNDTFKGSNLLNALKLMYYTLLLCFVKSHKSMGHNEVHKAYRELIKGMKKDFDGVLTLFAVKEDVRGRGEGKALLSKLSTYYSEHNTNRIYLYTDHTCNYGFYEHMGFQRLKEKRVNVLRENKESKLDVYLYGFNINNE